MKILVGMSGGIDSSFAAMKLKAQGHEVAGAVLIMHEYTDIDAARRVCEKLDIPLYEIDCRQAFDDNVKADFVYEYSNGRTPNPCIRCNQTVKFRRLYEEAIRLGFDRIATGHYARIVERMEGSVRRLAFTRSLDTGKDQTYMLYRLEQDILQKLVLPLSDEIKENVRERVVEQGIVPDSISESQEICFIPNKDYVTYLEERLGAFDEGDFVDDTGKVLGRHKGIVNYTIGQRKGLGIALGYRAFVSDIDPITNKVTLTRDGIPISRVILEDVVYSGMCKPNDGQRMDALVKLRYRAPLVKATVSFLQDGVIILDLHQPVMSVAPGQSAVIYDGDIVIAGGIIKKTLSITNISLM